MSDSRTTFCRYHCSACGGHFTSERAFDKHRRGAMEDRRCESPLDMEGTYLPAKAGACTLTRGEEKVEGISVWSVR